MEDLNITDLFENVSYIYNITDDLDDDEEDTFLHTLTIVTWIIISISLPLILISLYLLVREKHVLVYVINLLISGVIQLCCLIAIMADTREEVISIPNFIYWYAEIASIDFMVCVAFQRYLAIAHPLWYRFSRSVKVYVVVCVVVWLLPTVPTVLVFADNPHIDHISFGIIHLLPFPFCLFFLVGAVRALSAAIHLNSVEKRRIIGTLVLPILTYSLLFIPFIIMLLGEEIMENITLTLVTYIFLFLSPLANVILYVVIRKGFMDKVLMSLCRCKMDKNENSTLGTSLNEAAEGQLAPKN